MNIHQFFKKSNIKNWEEIWVEPDSGSVLDFDFSISPEEFLEFAEQDLEDKGKRGLVNSLTNSKRAIDCQVDKLLICFGISSKRKNFPKKLEILEELGAVAPRILRKVVNTRNFLEHEYVCPEKEQVEDSIDIATLFIETGNRALHFFPTNFTLIDGKNDSNFIYVKFSGENPLFTLSFYDGKEEQNITISSKDNEYYYSLIKLSFAVERDLDSKIESALNIFLKTFNLE